MSNHALDELRTELLSLPESDRAKLALELVSSLDGPTDTDVTEAWDIEVTRRLAEVDAGTVEVIDRAEFSRRVRARLSEV